MTRFLFSVDVEETQRPVAASARLSGRTPELVDRYLRFLQDKRASGTFFFVGSVARRNASVVRQIVGEGHEVACHSDQHIPLDRLTPQAFRADVSRNLDALHYAGVDQVCGYRAPCFSLVRSTRWAHDVLADLGFSYSSSVLPAFNPIHGWPGFGRSPKFVGALLEIPISLLPFPLPPLPAAGGVYFRNLPWWLVKRGLRPGRRDAAVAGYFHPHDVDNKVERCDHEGLRSGGVFHWLMSRNRHLVFERLDEAAKLGCRFENYRTYADELLSAAPPAKGAL